jgi:hypothetical protein
MSAAAKKALENKAGLVESIKGEELYHRYISFLDFHKQLVGAIADDTMAETEGESRVETTDRIIAASQGLEVMSERLGPSIREYVQYMEKNNIGTKEQRDALREYISIFSVHYKGNVHRLKEAAEKYKKNPANVNAYKHTIRTKRNETTFENHRANVAGLKYGYTSGRDSIDMNRFKKLLITTLPPRWAEKLAPKKNNNNCATKKEGCSIMGGRRRTHKRRYTKKSKTHKRH